MAAAASRRAVAAPRLRRAISARYSTDPNAARSTAPALAEMAGQPWDGPMPWPGRISPPASSEADTAIAPVTRKMPVKTAGVAGPTVRLLGVAGGGEPVMPGP